MATPLVSVCIPTFNGAAYLAEALASVKAQTFKNYEVVISDDNSQDNTLQIAEAFKKEVDIPVYIHCHSPKGIGANWNNCINKANGLYIKFLFQDDLMAHNCIEKMVDLIKSNDHVGLVACKREFILNEQYISDDINKWMKNFGNLQQNIPYEDRGDYLILNKKIFKARSFLSSPLNKIGEPSTYLFKKDLIAEIGYFREDLKQVLDYEFCYRVLKISSIAVIKEKLIQFRLHENQATNINKGKDQNDYKIYYEIIANNYFWYLNFKSQLKILKNQYPIIKYIFRIKHKLGF